MGLIGTVTFRFKTWIFEQKPSFNYSRRERLTSLCRNAAQAPPKNAPAVAPAAQGRENVQEERQGSSSNSSSSSIAHQQQSQHQTRSSSCLVPLEPALHTIRQFALLFSNFKPLFPAAAAPNARQSCVARQYVASPRAYPGGTLAKAQPSPCKCKMAVH
jgi:hypothetical protein